MQITSLVSMRKLQFNIPHPGGAETTIKSRCADMGAIDPT